MWKLVIILFEKQEVEKHLITPVLREEVVAWVSQSNCAAMTKEILLVKVVLSFGGDSRNYWAFWWR